MLETSPIHAYRLPESRTVFTGKVLVFYLKANMVLTESGLFHAQTEGLFFMFSQCRFTLKMTFTFKV